MTNHYFSSRPLLLFPKRLCVPNRLRKSAERSKSFLCFGFFLDTCTSKNPTAHIIIHVLRLFPARLVYAKPHRYWAYCTRYESVIIVRGFIRSRYAPMTYQHAPRHRVHKYSCTLDGARYYLSRRDSFLDTLKCQSDLWGRFYMMTRAFSQDPNGMIVLLAG